MSGKISAGIILYRKNLENTEIFLVHPGGPFFIKKDLGAWSIPKGEVEPDEEPFARAVKEMFEETGVLIEGSFLELGRIRQKGGKEVVAWAVEHNMDFIFDNSGSLFEIEWPPHSGRKQKFPEVDKGEFFELNTARLKINSGQLEFINRLEAYLINGI